jgi:hypothetical protein
MLLRPSNALTSLETFGLGWIQTLAANLQFDRAFQTAVRPPSSPITRELIFRHYAFEAFGLAFYAISNSSVRLDRQLLNHRINGRLLNGHSSLRSLNQVTNVIFWLVNMGHLSTRSLAWPGRFSARDTFVVPEDPGKDYIFPERRAYSSGWTGGRADPVVETDGGAAGAGIAA